MSDPRLVRTIARLRDLRGARQRAARPPEITPVLRHPLVERRLASPATRAAIASRLGTAAVSTRAMALAAERRPTR